MQGLYFLETRAAVSLDSGKNHQRPPDASSTRTRTAVTIIGAQSKPEKTKTVADDDITVEVIDAAAEQLASTQQEITRIEGLISTEEAQMAGFRDVITDAVTVLRAAAESTAAQVTQVVETTPKAPDVSATAIAAAQKVQAIAAENEATQILNGLVAYVDASRAAQTEHAAVVKREKEAAEAAARAKASNKTTAKRGGGKSKGSRLCSRFRPSPGGGGSLLLVHC